MLFALLCDDKPGALALRKDTRAAHLDYLASLGEGLAFAGPFLNEAGDPVGSMVVVEAESEEAARAIAANDPYAKAGLFAAVSVRRWNWALKNPKA
ncbi:YciI-like protein [Antarcticirhabdus aurantiaca]|uniref:YciI-like protein n=1 Tax=Antarcticirhabdus aurantiaca TaxID=2606717 RepID=A0ACD4NL72_9HYPH|nr:YciI-like protein [Antarcticirhabdus aurantiaca]WAJ27499.1 YciI-like protein [Jeongeuplla avenae]